jgi:hypothetical protein
MNPSSGAARAYTTIRSLRALGLGEVLRRCDEGYLLDPDVSFHLEEDH